MHQANPLSASERTTLEVLLYRVSASAFGSLAVIPLYCLGLLPNQHAREVVEEHYDRWRALLVAAREVAKGDRHVSAKAAGLLDELSAVLKEIRQGFIDLAEFECRSRKEGIASHRQIVKAYERLPECVAKFKKILAADFDPLLVKINMRRDYYRGTLTWIGDEIQRKFADPSARPGRVLERRAAK